MSLPDVYIDADGCPVKNEIYRAAAKYGLKVLVVANSFINVPTKGKVEMVQVPAGFDIADDWIAEHAKTDDVVVTNDIPLADRCIKNGARVIDSRGGEFTENSIGTALATRELMTNLRMMGEIGGGPPPFSGKNRSNFSSKLHQLLQAIIRPAQ
jgi:uncharacterized protein